MITENQIKKYEPFIHILLWMGVLSYPYVKYLGKENGYQESFIHEVNALIFIIITSYTSYFWFFSAKKTIFNILIIAIIFCLSALAFNFTDHYFHPNFYIDGWKQFFSSLITYFTFAILFYLLFIFKDYLRNQERLLTLEEENNKAQLLVFNAQINSHFLYNTLNMIYSNAVSRDENTPELILKASHIFRFITDKNSERNLITEEIEYMSNYIELQKQRLISKVDVSWNFDYDNDTQKIATLLFIPFIENAFKYTSLLKGQNHKLKISLILKSGILSFFCKNPHNLEQNRKQSTIERKGKGILMTRNRLNLLYKNKFQLKTTINNSFYEVYLSIDLK